MRPRRRPITTRGSAWPSLGLLVGLVAPADGHAQVGPAAAATASAADASRAALRAALCPPGRRCALDFVLAAGRDAGGAPLAVVRVRTPRRRDAERCDPYADWLVAVRRGRVVRLRELVVGSTLCLEWQPSAWTFEHGELVFERAAGMGAPPPRGTDTRPRRTHLRPWPLAVTANYARDATGSRSDLPLPVVPARGPIFRMDMEHEGQ